VDLHPQVREVTFRKEAAHKVPFPKVQERVPAACGIGKQNIHKTLQESGLAIKKCGRTSFVSRKNMAKRRETGLAYALKNTRSSSKRKTTYGEI
jgi:hypothetical protein